MQLFYAPEISLSRYTLPEEESKHCVRVLRMGVGDELFLTDGKGTLHRCKVVNDNAKRCEVEVVESRPEYGRLPYELHVAIAPTKNIDRFEWFLEKATEVGISDIWPIECDHSERRQIKEEREAKVITAAMKQSLKAYHPTLHPLTPLRKLLTAEFDGQRYIAHCNGALSDREYLGSIVKKGGKILILIGPEGDFSPEEITFALENGFRAITLGNQRLRTETAALMATVLVANANAL